MSHDIVSTSSYSQNEMVFPKFSTRAAAADYLCPGGVARPFLVRGGGGGGGSTGAQISVCPFCFLLSDNFVDGAHGGTGNWIHTKLSK